MQRPTHTLFVGGDAKRIIGKWEQYDYMYRRKGREEHYVVWYFVHLSRNSISCLGLMGASLAR
jgi:hypothetical protein